MTRPRQRRELPLFGVTPALRAWTPSDLDHPAAHAEPLSWRRRLSRYLSGAPQRLRWATAGFGAGAIFWHFVGFWSFMSQIMFSSPQSPRQAVAPQAGLVSGAASGIETGSINPIERRIAPKTEPGCISIVRNPDTNSVTQIQCRKLSKPLITHQMSTRQDRLPAQVDAAKQESWQPIAQPAFELEDALPLTWPQTSAGR